MQAEWERNLELRSEILLDEWMVMPDHLHAIVVITFTAESPPPQGQRAPRSLSSLVAGFKSSVTSRINAMRGVPTKVWQRNFWEHIIRNERELQIKRRYIQENAARWTVKHADVT